LAYPKEQQAIHALTGGNQSAEAFTSELQFLNNDGDLVSEGRALRRFGDSFAHSRMDNGSVMYGREGYTTEHFTAKESDGTSTGLRPDLINERPELYLLYVEQLANLISVKYKETRIEGLDLCKFGEMVDFAVQNKCSLIGIINYEVALYQGEKSFIVAQPIGAIPSLKAHEENLIATRKYLTEQGTSFTEEKLFSTSTDIFGIETKTYMSTKFTITNEK
jgi:hypothetical protein